MGTVGHGNGECRALPYVVGVRLVRVLDGWGLVTVLRDVGRDPGTHGKMRSW